MSLNQTLVPTPSDIPTSVPSEQLCSFMDLQTAISWYTMDISFFLLIANGISSITAVSSNLLVLCAILRTPSLRQSPKNTLLCSLSSSDIFVGLLSQTSFMVQIETRNTSPSNACIFWFLSETFGGIGAGVTFLTLFVMSIERYICLLYPLRYEAIVTKSRVIFVLVSCWIFTVSSLLARFLVAEIGLIAHVLMPVLLILNCFIHLKIIFLVRHHKRAIRDVTRHLQSNQRRALDVASRTKTALTMTYLFALFLVCYTPLFCCFVIMAVEGRVSANLHVALGVSVTVVYINSSLNPAFYCWRMREIRRALWKLYKNGVSRQ
ncbi:melanocyte-stimulating hormone receptor-like [Oculina patagonica]